MSPAMVRDEMRETNRIFEEEVVAKGDFEALGRVYTSDARILPPGMDMIAGREGIKAFWKGAIEAMGVKSGRLETVDAQNAGEYIHEIGRASLVLGDGSTAHVKYVVVWKKEDGAWKWHIDIWNPNA